MKFNLIGTGSELVKLMVCSFMGVFLLFSAIGCEQDTVTPLGDVNSNEDDSEVVATVFVDASIGSDDYDGSSLTFKGNGVGPKKTIQAGVDITPKNRICYVASGNYCEQITMAEGVILAGAGAATTFIDGGDKRGNIITIWDCDVAQTIVCGFTIHNGSCYGDNAGIRIQNSSNVVIRNNVITANRADGIRVYSSSANIVNNTITGNRNGIMACVSSNLEVVNNIIVDNTLWGLYSTSWAVINSSYNNIWKHNIDYGIGTKGICSPGTGDVSIDPVFADPGRDFHLSSESLCIDAGVAVGLEYHGEAPDMGAFEYKR
jgi:parallel beta-helix repeat protein